MHFGIPKRDAPVMQTCPVMDGKRRHLNRQMTLLMKEHAELDDIYAEANRYHREKDLAAYRRAYTEYTGFMDNLQDEIKDFLESPNACEIMTIYGNQFKNELDMYDKFLDKLIHPDNLEEFVTKKRNIAEQEYQKRNS